MLISAISHDKLTSSSTKENNAKFSSQMAHDWIVFPFLPLLLLCFVQLYLSMPVKLRFSANVVRLPCLKNGWFCNSIIFGRSSAYLQLHKNFRHSKHTVWEIFIFDIPFHTNLSEFVKMITKLSFSINLVGLVRKIVINIRGAASWGCW